MSTIEILILSMMRDKLNNEPLRRVGKSRTYKLGQMLTGQIHPTKRKHIGIFSHGPMSFPQLFFCVFLIGELIMLAITFFLDRN